MILNEWQRRATSAGHAQYIPTADGPTPTLNDIINRRHPEIKLDRPVRGTKGESATDPGNGGILLAVRQEAVPVSVLRQFVAIVLNVAWDCLAFRIEPNRSQA